MLSDGVLEAFELQSYLCQRMGSPLYAEILRHVADDLRGGGIAAEIVDDWQGNAAAEALALRFLGAVHRLVLDGRAPRLAAHYPSAGGTPEWPSLWGAFHDTLERHAPFVRTRLQHQVQTNEVARSAALLGGVLEIVRRTSLPVRLREIGASAGLNLWFDRYSYEFGNHTWGDATATVHLRCESHGPAPPLHTPLAVESRRGCDLAPVDVRDPEQARNLESFVWPDQIPRLTQLRAAICLVARQPACVDRERAEPWLRSQLAQAASGVNTVVYHSTMWWYLPETERDAIRAMLEKRGASATEEAPFAWLQFEPRQSEKADLVLRLWPGGNETLLATCHAHASEIWWS